MGGSVSTNRPRPVNKGDPNSIVSVGAGISSKHNAICRTCPLTQVYSPSETAKPQKRIIHPRRREVRRGQETYAVFS